MTIKEQIERGKTLDYITADQLALRLQYDRETVYRKAKKGTIPGAVRIDGRWRFIRAEIETWITHTLRHRPAPRTIDLP